MYCCGLSIAHFAIDKRLLRRWPGDARGEETLSDVLKFGNVRADHERPTARGVGSRFIRTLTGALIIRAFYARRPWRAVASQARLLTQLTSAL